jgi:hypothetical protein
VRIPVQTELPFRSIPIIGLASVSDRTHRAEAAGPEVAARAAAQFYADRLTAPVLRYLAGRGFPETFVRQRRIGYALVSSTRDLLVRQIRGAARSNGTQLLREAIEDGLVVQDKAGNMRDFFASETHGYIVFPNVIHGHVVDLQGRAYPTPARRSAYLNRSGPICHLYNAGDAGQRSVLLCEGIPDTLSVLVAGLKDSGACGVWDGRLAVGLAAAVSPDRPRIRCPRPRRDRPSHCARTDVWDSWARPHLAGGPRAEGRSQRELRVGAKGDPAAFRSILEQGLATSATPWALQIRGLPPDLAPWDLEDYPGVRDLLCEIGHQGPLSRDAHLRLLAKRYGVVLATLQEAARELAQSGDAKP